MLTFYAEYDFALIYSLNHPKLARECALKAIEAAEAEHRPDLAYRANELLCQVGR